MRGLSRRGLLAGAAALGAIAGARPARAAGGELRFVFVVASGGWDPTRALVRAWESRGAEVEPGSGPGTLGDLAWVDHPARPAVRAFFERWAERSLILNGMLVRSIAHDACRRLLLTGGPAGDTPDWPAILAARGRETYALPHVVLGGPSFAGGLGAGVARTGAYGQLGALLDGSVNEGLDLPAPGLSAPAIDLVERFLARRGPAWVAETDAAGRGLAFARAWEDARGRAQALSERASEVHLGRAADFPGKIDTACALLSSGTSRCVTLDTGSGSLFWDTHTDNDPRQSPLWDGLFEGLARLMEGLSASPGVNAPTLLEETCVVVLSEMGRTPVRNATLGKDHWPYTSALLLGSGFTGGRTLGAVGDGLVGVPIDPVSGRADPAGQVASSATLGATLLAMGDTDPGEWTDAPILAL